MQLANYHAKYFAHELPRRCPPGSVDQFAAALAGAKVDLNPHQVDAALFAFRSERSLLVLCTAFRGQGEYANLTVKKIPRQVLSRCEWGHDDFSLRVENLPQKPPEPGQQDLGLD